MLATWPEEVARPIAEEIHNVLRPRRDLVTLGLIFAIYFASSGIESLRIGLNRAYGMVETRYWLMLRLESIGYVVLGAAAMLALGFLIVLGPLLFRIALAHAPWLEPLEGTFTFLRFGDRHRRARSSRWWLRTNGCRPAAAGGSRSCPASS